VSELNLRQAIEAFHLHFLRALLVTSDRKVFVLKGGCNLRFFYGSPRYSEDMDLDASVIAKGTLKNKVDRLLESSALRLPLQSLGMELGDVSSPKQTETTQRWKLAIKLAGTGVPARTKVEFSRREKPTGAIIEAIGSRIATAYRVPGFVAAHYEPATAISQKLAALVGRPQTQARDVFDLDLLFARLPPEASPKELKAALQRSLEAAKDRILSLSFVDFSGQVLAYLEPDLRAQYTRAETWEQLQLSVIGRLEELAQ
jgi:predicted nucleotidyltransferase component of viral defense system